MHIYIWSFSKKHTFINTLLTNPQQLANTKHEINKHHWKRRNHRKYTSKNTTKIQTFDVLHSGDSWNLSITGWLHQLSLASWWQHSDWWSSPIFSKVNKDRIFKRRVASCWRTAPLVRFGLGLLEPGSYCVTRGELMRLYWYLRDQSMWYCWCCYCWHSNIDCCLTSLKKTLTESSFLPAD